MQRRLPTLMMSGRDIARVRTVQRAPVCGPHGARPGQPAELGLSWLQELQEPSVQAAPGAWPQEGQSGLCSGLSMEHYCLEQLFPRETPGASPLQGPTWLPVLVLGAPQSALSWVPSSSVKGRPSARRTISSVRSATVSSLTQVCNV